MVEAVQAMQSMMMSNASAGLAAMGPVVGERPKKSSQRSKWVPQRIGDSKSSGHTPTSHRPKRLCKRRPSGSMSRSGLSLESNPESGSESEVGSTTSP